LGDLTKRDRHCRAWYLLVWTAPVEELKAVLIAAGRQRYLQRAFAIGRTISRAN